MNEVLRQEKKYLINTVLARKLGAYLASAMTEDSHSGAEGYPVRSLYFDTLNDGDFGDKLDGLELRRKIRLRTYDPAGSFAMLEMKQKSGALQKKRSLRMEREDAVRLIRGDTGVLLKYGEDFAAECYALMHILCYRPKTVVEYKRRAFIAKENKVRITIDSHIISSESCFNIFSERLVQHRVLDPYNAVLEVKYNGFLPSYIKELASAADCSEISVSKYCLARSVGLHYAG